ncbi:MAG: L-histidine N(alpha)-methyltransferase [Rhodospirillales bacterium]
MSPSVQAAPAPLPPAQESDDFATAVLAGLASEQKSIPCKYLYDKRGARLFTMICRLPEYYPTRTEFAMLRRYGRDIANRLPARSVLVEFGSGTSRKVDLILGQMAEPAAYVPLDVSAPCLAAAVQRLAGQFPALRIAPAVADFSQPFQLPPGLPSGPRVGFFPGSTIGNFDPPAAVRLLARFGAVLGPRCRLIVGVDLRKDTHVLHTAYNDGAGITAAFNLNLLLRANRELGANFDLDGFFHRADVNRRLGRVEMHLVSRRRQSVVIAGHRFEFAPGETIHTENSYKYSLAGFRRLAEAAGFAVKASWTDDRQLFSLHLLFAGERPAGIDLLPSE